MQLSFDSMVSFLSFLFLTIFCHVSSGFGYASFLIQISPLKC